jgi:cytochrome c oxidase subunit 2
VIVTFLWFTSWQTQDEITSLSDDPDLEVEVVGFQWQWQFRYQEGDEVPTAFDVDADSDPSMEPPEMVLPVGSTVHLHLVANDVIHSFWVPEFLEKRDLVPEIENTIEVVVTEEGEWTGRCAEFCGLNHWQMYFSVRAVPLEEFRAWVADSSSSGGATS